MSWLPAWASLEAMWSTGLYCRLSTSTAPICDQPNRAEKKTQRGHVCTQAEGLRGLGSQEPGAARRPAVADQRCAGAGAGEAASPGPCTGGQWAPVFALKMNHDVEHSCTS